MPLEFSDLALLGIGALFMLVNALLIASLFYRGDRPPES